MSRMINRAAVIVRPKKPFLDWAASTDEEAPEHVKDWKDHVSIYLVGEDPQGRQETAPLKRYFQAIFERELGGWYTDKRAWPKTRDLKTFREWFDVVGESVIIDLEGGPLKTEEI